MSNSLLYHGFGITDVDYLKTEYQGGAIYFHVKTKDEKLSCVSCGSQNVIKKGVNERTFKTLPIGLKPVYIVGQIQRLECKSCGAIQQEEIKYADKKNLIQDA